MTVATFKAGLEALSVSGVAREMDQIDIDPPFADLPAKYVTLPESVHEFTTYGKVFVPTREAQIVILVRPVVMGRTDESHTDMETLADNLRTAIASGITNVALEAYTIALEQIEVNGTSYHAVVATVTGRDK